MFHLDPKLARGYAREYISKLPKFMESNSPFDLDIFCSDLPTRLSAEKASKTLNLIGEKIFELAVINKRTRIYLSHYLAKSGKYKNSPYMGLSLSRAKVGSSTIDLIECYISVFISLHALGRLVERTRMKPSKDTFTLISVIEWSCMYNFIFRDTDAMYPAILPTSSGMFFGESYGVKEVMQDSNFSVIKRSLKRGKHKTTTRTPKYVFPCFRECDLSTFVSKDMFFDNQRKLYDEFHTFRMQNRDIFRIVVGFTMNEPAMTFSELEANFGDKFEQCFKLFFKHLDTIKIQIKKNNERYAHS